FKACVPPSGSSFSLGTTTVVCTATNVCSTNTCTFSITVVQTPAPMITCPPPISTNTCATNLVVNFPNPTVSGGSLKNCAPPSGSPFVPGTTTVLCTA